MAYTTQNLTVLYSGVPHSSIPPDNSVTLGTCLFPRISAILGFLRYPAKTIFIGPLFHQFIMSSTTNPLEARRAAIDNARSVVVKVGTRVVTDAEGKLDHRRIELLSAQLARIADTGRQTLMVSSGAVGAGMGKLRLDQRPSGLAQLQAVAAVGQTDLIQAYENAMSKSGRHVAQVLLTAADLRRRSAYLHVRNALNQIHAFGAIGIVNENDSVAVSELMTTFGDNDRLAAQVAGLLNDAMLIILSDVDGLYDGSPENPDSSRISIVETIDDQILGYAQDHNSAHSKGGMASKLEAAKVATAHGQATIIAPGRDDDVLDKIFSEVDIGTIFLPNNKMLMILTRKHCFDISRQRVRFDVFCPKIRCS